MTINGIEINDIKVKDWFASKIHIPNGYNRPRILLALDVLKETEKAIQIEFEILAIHSSLSDSYHKAWIPKSCIESYKAYMEANQARFEEGKAKYEKMVAFAKANGVKGIRKGMRKETILKKIAEANLEYQW